MKSKMKLQKLFQPIVPSATAECSVISMLTAQLDRQVRWLLTLQVNTFQIRVSYDSLVFLGTIISFQIFFLNKRKVLPQLLYQDLQIVELYQAQENIAGVLKFLLVICYHFDIHFFFISSKCQSRIIVVVFWIITD